MQLRRPEIATTAELRNYSFDERRILTDHVLVETWRLIAHRLSPRHAERWWGGIRGGVAEIEVVGEADLACLVDR